MIPCPISPHRELPGQPCTGCIRSSCPLLPFRRALASVAPPTQSNTLHECEPSQATSFIPYIQPHDISYPSCRHTPVRKTRVSSLTVSHFPEVISPTYSPAVASASHINRYGELDELDHTAPCSCELTFCHDNSSGSLNLRRSDHRQCPPYRDAARGHDRECRAPMTRRSEQMVQVLSHTACCCFVSSSARCPA